MINNNYNRLVNSFSMLSKRLKNGGGGGVNVLC